MREDSLEVGLRADGLAGVVSTSIGGIFGWVIGNFTSLDSKFGTAIGAFCAATFYIIFSFHRRRVLMKHEIDNAILRDEMMRDFSKLLQSDASQPKISYWNLIMLKIADSELSERNQKILERELKLSFEIKSEDPRFSTPDILSTSWHSTLHDLAHNSLIDGELKGARRQFEILLEHSLKDGNGFFVSAALKGLGTVYHAQERFDFAQDFFQRSLEHDIQNNNQRGQAVSYEHLALLYKAMHKFEEAEESITNSLIISQKIEYIQGQASALHLLGTLAKRAGRHAIAEEFYARAQPLFEGLKIND